MRNTCSRGSSRRRTWVLALSLVSFFTLSACSSQDKTPVATVDGINGSGGVEIRRIDIVLTAK